MQNRQPPAFTENLEEKSHSSSPGHSEKALKIFVSVANGLFHSFPSNDEFLPFCIFPP